MFCELHENLPDAAILREHVVACQTWAPGEVEIMDRSIVIAVMRHSGPSEDEAQAHRA